MSAEPTHILEQVWKFVSGLQWFTDTKFCACPIIMKPNLKYVSSFVSGIQENTENKLRAYPEHNLAS